jgi:hypothetical protein
MTSLPARSAGPAPPTATATVTTTATDNGYGLGYRYGPWTMPVVDSPPALEALQS